MSKDKKSSGIIKTLVISLVSVGVGAGGLWYYNTTQAKAVGPATDVPAPAVAQPPAPVLAPVVAAEPIFLDLLPFTVTLRNDFDSRVIYTGMTIRLTDAASKQRLEKYLPIARSRILFELTGLNPSTAGERDALKAVQEKIKLAMREPFTPEQQGQHVEDVLFTSFVVQ